VLIELVDIPRKVPVPEFNVFVLILPEFETVAKEVVPTKVAVPEFNVFVLILPELE